MNHPATGPGDLRSIPGTPPYGGKSPDIVPHLSVAWVQDGQRCDEFADVSPAPREEDCRSPRRQQKSL